MYMNHVGRDITISLDTQEEAAALYAVLSGTPTVDDKAKEFGNRVYAFFYEAVRKLAMQFDHENKGIRPVARKPKKGVVGSVT